MPTSGCVARLPDCTAATARAGPPTLDTRYGAFRRTDRMDSSMTRTRAPIRINSSRRAESSELRTYPNNALPLTLLLPHVLADSIEPALPADRLKGT
jgi:hypothetical protein